MNEDAAASAERKLPVTLAGMRRMSSRSGQLLFSGSITPHDPHTGRLVTQLDQAPAEIQNALVVTMLTDIPMEAAGVQTWRIYMTLAMMLTEQGATFDDLLRQRIFLSDMRDLPAVDRIMNILMPGTKPATTVVEVPTHGVDQRIRIQLDAIALVPDGPLRKETIEIPELMLATSGYPQATRAGQWVFLSTMLAVNPSTGQLARRLDELGSDAAQYTGQALRTRQAEEILVQTWFIFKNLDRVLSTVGAGLADILKVNGWLGYMMRDVAPMVVVRERLFKEAGSLPASCSIGVSGLMLEGAHEGYEAIAIVPPSRSGDHAKLVPKDAGKLAAMYVLVAQGGPLIITCGEVPVDVTMRGAITSYEDLRDEGRFLGFGRVSEEVTIEARAWFVYQAHKRYLALRGVGFKDVVHQTVYMCRPEEFSALERVASVFLGSPLPPTTLVPITDTSPYRSSEIEIELIAYSDKDGVQHSAQQ